VTQISSSTLLRAFMVLVLLASSPLVAKEEENFRQSTADHGAFEQLKQNFETGPDVTKACLGCHTNAARQIHQSKHWTWEFKHPETGQMLGKRHVINNFCLAATPNIDSCSSCHIGYGWEDGEFDFASEEHVDCLVCHDTTGTYTRLGLIDPEKKKPNLKKIAQNVGKTSRETCGSCHFQGGGGKGVKHGDMDPSLVHPDIFVDVHMDADGMNFSCSTCHVSDAHEIGGSRYAPTAVDQDQVAVAGRENKGRTTCRSCHGGDPHEKDERLNHHARTIACQTCHIPKLSRGDYPSKMWWDWSEAGKRDEKGEQYTITDEAGHELYTSKKGAFTWERDNLPEYRWFNGTILYTLPGDEIDPESVVKVNELQGGPGEGDSRIWPVKIMRGKQPYDLEFKTLLTPRTVGEDGYWKTLNWNQALTLGSEAMNKRFSGAYGFVETEMAWLASHMVPPADQSLGCADCHSKQGRLAGIGGIYIPGTGSAAWLDRIGVFIVLATLLGILGHGAFRLLLRLRRR